MHLNREPKSGLVFKLRKSLREAAAASALTLVS